MATQLPDAILKSKKVYYLWCFFLMLAIAPFFLLCIYTFPSIHDDYLGANYIIKSGAIDYIQTNYLHWTGRYTELLIKSVLSPLVYNNSDLISHVLPMLVLAIMGIVIYFICTHFVEKRDALQLSLILFVVFICSLTDIGSFFYWSGGYTAYTIGVVFFMLFLIFLYKMKNNNSFIYLILCSVFAVFSIGCYEVILINVVWVTLANVIYSKINKKGLGSACILFVISIIGALFSMLAPGNSARASGIGSKGATLSVFGLIVSAVKSFLFAITSFVAWADNIVVILGFFLVFHLLIRSGKIKFGEFRIHPIIVLIWVITGLSVGIFPSVLAYQAVWIHTWQCVYFFFMISLLVVIGSFVGYYDKNSNIKNIILGEKTILCVRLLFIFIVFINSSSNVYNAFWDLLYAPEYKHRVERRIANASNAAKLKSVFNLQPLYSNSEKYMVPKTLYTLEYNQSDADAFATYYGIDSVVVSRCHW